MQFGERKIMMPNYSVRVELRGNPSFETYEKLHALMKKQGFLQTVTGDKGTSALPHATYYGWSSYSCEEVRNLLVADIKSNVQTNIIVFVAQTVKWALGG
jgi:hypothetical protein